MDYTNKIAGHVRELPRSGIRDFFAIVQQMPQAISLGIGTGFYHALEYSRGRYLFAGKRKNQLHG